MNIFKNRSKYFLISTAVFLFLFSVGFGAHAFDLSRIQATKDASGDITRHLGSTQAGYYGYSLQCIQTDILDKKDQMNDPVVRQKAQDCIKYYKIGFQNLNQKYTVWESTSRGLRDALQNEK